MDISIFKNTIFTYYKCKNIILPSLASSYLEYLEKVINLFLYLRLEVDDEIRYVSIKAADIGFPYMQPELSQTQRASSLVIASNLALKLQS